MHSATGRPGVFGALAALALAGSAAYPAHAQMPRPSAKPAEEPIISDREFEDAVPSIPADNDPVLGQKLEPIDEFERKLAVPANASASTGQDAELAAPLPPLETFQAEPAVFAQDAAVPEGAEVSYRVELAGLEEVVAASGTDLLSEFQRLSLLRRKGTALNTTQLSSRAGEDVLVLKKLLAASGWFDALVTTRIDRVGDDGSMVVAMAVAPGRRFAFSSIAIDAAPTLPPDLIRTNLELAVGQPVIAEKVLAAEAKVGLSLRQNGYPFAEVGVRDVLLDPETGEAAYTLPVTIGQRGTYGAIRSEGNEAFSAAHVQTLARFKPGELYDSRMVDDLRQALIATGLFRAIAVEPKSTAEAGPNGTERVDLVVKQEAGPPRVIAATAGYGTGEGFRVEGSWIHRNLFRPEGALIVSGVAGTREQGAGVTFRRANAGERDRTFEMAGELRHATTDAYSAYTGRLAARVSYDSTPIWQKRLTYAYGAQLIGTDESVFDPVQRARTRRTYAIAGLTGQIGWDGTDSLLDPTRGFRLTALVEPEGSVRGSFTPYTRLRLDGSAYYQVGANVILAGRVRLASIQGAELDDIAPSRRLYAGGGGSVRGFAYQQLGPRDSNNDPTGARSLNEAAFEVRYRFGDYGVAGFVDVGQAYARALPDFSDLRVGIGLGARIYTNFGPMRLDVATPLQRRPGESKINVYVSIGQAF